MVTSRPRALGARALFTFSGSVPGELAARTGKSWTIMKVGLARSFLCMFVFIVASWAGPPGVLEPRELWVPADAPWLDDRQAVVYAEDLSTGERYAFVRSKIKDRHPPFSSFKLPHTLIALETGVAADLEHSIAYDPSKRPPASYWPRDWAQDQTLASAFERSAAWYYQDLTQSIPSDTYRGYIGHFGYGQSDFADGNDSFWLDGSLRVSAKEQASFLRRLLIGQLEVSPQNIELLSAVSVVKRSGDLVLHGKTGAGPQKAGDFDGPFEGWFVGWLERPAKAPVVFAAWVSAPSYESLRPFRQEVAETMLERIGVWP